MTAIPKKFGFIRTTLALWAGNLFPGRAGVVTDAPVGSSTSETWGWYDGSAWKYAAKRGGDETFGNISVTGLTSSGGGTITGGKFTLAPAAAGYASLNIPTRSAAVTTPIAGDFESDGTYLNQHGLAFVNRIGYIEARQEAAAEGNIICSVPAGRTANIRFSTSCVSRWILRKNSTAEPGGNAGSDLELVASNDAGGAIDTVLSITRAAGGAVSINRKINASSGVGFYGVAAPTVRPTVNAACTDLASCIALTNQLRTHLIDCGLVQ